MSRVEIESKISTVTVYENRAQVHRTAKTVLGAGVTTIVFDDIPRSVDRDSIQVGVRVDASAKGAPALNGITFEQRKPSPAADGDAAASAAATTSELDKTDAAIVAVKCHLDTLEIDRAMLAREVDVHDKFWQGCVARRSNEPSETYTDIEKWQALLESHLKSQKDFLGRRRAHVARQRELDEKLETLTAERAKLAAKAPKKPADVPLMLVHLESKEDLGKVDILVSYMMSNASWKAAYDIRVNMKTKQASLTYHAVVQQNTGESWDDVSLTMSTAKPSVSGRAPDLQRWYANIVVPQVHGGRTGGGMSKAKKSSGVMRGQAQMAQAKGGARRMWDASEQLVLDDEGGSAPESDDDEDDGDEAASPAWFETAEVGDATSTAVTFDVPHQHSIPSTNDPIRVSLTTISLTPEISYATRPSMAEVAYAIMTATNPSNFTIMPGEANVFVDGQFVTKTSLGRIAPKNNLRTGLGQESTISVKYKSLKEEHSQSGGMLSAKRKMKEYFRSCVVKNLRDEPVVLRVEHETPTAEDSRIEIQLLEPSPLPPNSEHKDGKLVLTIELAAREERKIPIRIAVSYPQDLALAGL